MARIWVFALATAMLGGGCARAQDAPAGRQVRLIDAGWRFEIGDHPGAETVRFDNAGWQRVGLPHSFGLPYFGSAKFYVGYGWYRKHLRVDGPVGNLKGRREFLEFEAAFQDAEVWVNGKRVGEHKGVYTGFSLDATEAVKTGDNVIAVRLNNLWNATLNPRGGEHNFNGGIYRNVYLVTTDAVHVAWYGTFVTTPGLSGAGGPVHVETEVRNDGGVGRPFTLRTDVMDASGRQVATATSEERVAAGSVRVVEQETGFVAKPALWIPAHPAMYRAVTRVTVDGREVDRYETPFGFRWLVDETHALDPTRPAAIGGVQRGQIDKIGDVAGYNGDGATLFLDPGVANAVTEYGSTIADRPGKYEPGFGALAQQPQFKWRSGQALWCAFDHGSIFTDMGKMGMIDYFRLPKRMWFWYRN